MQGEERAAYGASVIKKLSKELTEEYGKGFEETSLYWFVRFYKAFPEIFDTVCKKSVLRLSWSHFRTLLQVEDSSARTWYMQEAISQTWSVRTIQRNISSQYYYRLLQSQRKDLVEKEMLEITAPMQDTDKYEFVKNPTADFSDTVDNNKVFEFLADVRKKKGLWNFEFEKAQDIKDILKTQLSYKE